MQYADWSSGRTTVGVQRLSEALGWSQNTVRKHLERLESAGAIVRHARAGTTAAISIQSSKSGLPQELHTPPADIEGPLPQELNSSDATIADDLESVPDTGSEITQIAVVEQRAANPHWDALVHIFGEPTNGSRSLFGKMAKIAADSGPADLIPQRANVYMQAFRGAALTLPAFVKHWSYLGSPAAQASALSPQERRQVMPKQTLADRLRLEKGE